MINGVTLMSVRLKLASFANSDPIFFATIVVIIPFASIFSYASVLLIGSQIIVLLEIAALLIN